jgi:hypothetical protein
LTLKGRLRARTGTASGRRLNGRAAALFRNYFWVVGGGVPGPVLAVLRCGTMAHCGACV